MPNTTRDQRPRPRSGRMAPMVRRALSTGVKLLLIFLGLFLALLLFLQGLDESHLLKIIGGALGAALAGVLTAELMLRALRPRTPNWVMVAAGLVVAIVAVGLAVFLTTGKRVEVASACTGQGLSTAAPYEGGPGPHPVEVVSNGRRIWSPPAGEWWRPTSTEETELVACVSPIEQYVIETCSYNLGNITRYGYRREVTLVSARTGEPIASKTFRGEPPRACAQTEDLSTRKLTGSRSVDTGAIYAWLSEYVITGQELGSGSGSGGSPGESAIPAMPPSIATVPIPMVEPAVPVREEEVPAAEEPVPVPVGPDQSVVVTPGSQPPAKRRMLNEATLWSSPIVPREELGIVLEKDEWVEILATTEFEVQVRWTSPEGTTVTGWILWKDWVDLPDSVGNP